MASELKDKGLELVMIAFRETPELVRRTLKERGYTAQVLLDESGDITGRVYGVFGPPETYFIGADGIIAGRHIGPIDEQTLLTGIETLRAKSVTR